MINPIGLNNDYLFKKVFIKEQFCRKLLKDIFEIELETFEYSNREMIKENKHLSYGVSDMILKTDNETIILELQNKNQHNIENRSMMYLSKIYSEQWDNNNYKELKPVTICIILNYKYKKKEIQEYQMLETELHEKFGNNLKVKIWNIKAKNQTEIQKEYKSLFNLKEDLKTLEEKSKLKEIVKLMKEYNMDKKEYQKMKEREKMEWTLKDEIRLCEMGAHQRGRLKGEREGRKAGKIEGKIEGKLEGKIETAKNMLERNFNFQTISEITGLSKSEIEKHCILNDKVMM